MTLTIGMVINIKLKMYTLTWQKIRLLPGKRNKINRGSLHEGFCKFLPHEFNSKFNTVLDTNIRDVTNFIRTSLSSMRKSHLKSTHEVLNEVLKNKQSDIIFGQNTQENLCIILFNKGVEFINIERILRDPDITSPLPTVSVKFPISIITYELGLTLSTRSLILINLSIN